MTGKHVAMLTSLFVLTLIYFLRHTDLPRVPGTGQLCPQPRSQRPLSRGRERTTVTKFCSFHSCVTSNLWQNLIPKPEKVRDPVN